MTQVLNHNQMERSYRGPNQDEIQYYDERLSKRRERDRNEQRMNDFLTSSMRTSARLKSIEKQRRTKGQIPNVNKAYEDDGEASVSELTDFDVTRLTEAVCTRRNVRNSVAKSDLDWLQTVVKSDSFRLRYDSCIRIPEIITRYQPLRQPQYCTEAHNMACDIQDETARVVNSPRKGGTEFKFQIEELCDMLSPENELYHFLEALADCADIANRQVEARRQDNKREPTIAGISVDAAPTPKQPRHSNDRRPNDGNKRSAPGTTRKISSRLPNCYALIHDTESGIPLKTVFLEKGKQPLGATVRNERDAVIVGRIVVGGVAEKSGLLREGDEILSVNSIELTGKDVNEVSDILARMTGSLKFTVASQETLHTLTRQNKGTNTIHLRALFSYSPIDDAYIPCKEIGLSFERGQILHVTNIQDPNWWQAYRDVDEGKTASSSGGGYGGSLGDLAGLIPSPDYQYSRERLRRELGMDDSGIEDVKMSNDPQNHPSRNFLKKNKKQQPATVNGWIYNVDSSGLEAGKKSRKRLGGGKKSSYYPGDIEGNGQDPSIITYEEVQLFLPQPHRKRPIVLVGSELTGRHEIVKRIVNSDSDAFSLVKQHTTYDEADNDYLIVTRDVFKHMLNQEDFVETASFEKNLYGTSKQEVKSIVDSGKTAVLVLQPESLAVMRRTNLLPYVIYLSPPLKLNELRNLRMQFDEMRPSDHELHATIMKTKAIDIKYGHLFDCVIDITSINNAAEIALSTIRKLDREPQWVPINWVSGRISRSNVV